ncbi:hypothetical protein C8R45DRAFT_171694 [Mycena sanguinolenta]|nr:hypothetical protein C8R45DRAFT_171694 [Mycena sanguinolenta]
MAAPFVFVPEADASNPYAAYQNPYFASPQPALTPILPPAALLPTPNAFNPNSALWPEDATQYESAYTAQWVPLAPRQRTLSWTGPAPPRTSPFLAPTVPAFLQAQPFQRGHKKSNSWSNTPGWVNNVNVNPYFNPAAALLIHPFLNGDAPSPAFHFDLAPATFMPMRLVTTNPPSGALVSQAELADSAFHPPVFALRILHPRLPLWPVELALPAHAHAPPISLAAILIALHRAMHARITAAEWATLGPEDQKRVTWTFTARCRAEALRSGGSPAHMHNRALAVRNQGVLRVDFLQGKTVFRGLVRHSEGFVHMVTSY